MSQVYYNQYLQAIKCDMRRTLVPYYCLFRLFWDDLGVYPLAPLHRRITDFYQCRQQGGHRHGILQRDDAAEIFECLSDTDGAT
jgi:hypothetical protein